MAERIRLVFGGAFADSDERGDVDTRGRRERGTMQGLFFRDARHLSRWRLHVDGRTWEPLDADAVGYNRAVFTLGGAIGDGIDGIDAILTRERRLGAAMSERFTVTNHAPRERELVLCLTFDADFADLLDISHGQAQDQPVTRTVSGDRVRFAYRQGDFCRTTTVCAPDAELTGESASYRIRLPPGGRWTTEVRVDMLAEAHGHTWPGPNLSDPASEAQDWLADTPRLTTDWPDLDRAYRRCLADFAALRFHPDVVARSWMPGAGVPWYMTLFGRDSLITSYQTLPFLPGLCRTTLHALASRQAQHRDDERDAEPGKILHELRHGPAAYSGRRPQSPYYGSADATSLFLIVLDEYHRWTGDAALVRELEPAARAALRWVEEFGDLDGSGYIKYQTRNPEQGLANQCWKDSPVSVLYPDGRLAPLPRGTCELQGYAYDARLRCARLARAVWGDAGLADRLERDAAAFRDRFNTDFWLAAGGYYALAIDGDRRLVPTLASNFGQLLWSGIVPPERVDPLVGHLMGDALFSGWGIRTVATGQAVYNPVAYHNGTVWPHDNSLIAAGLARYGRHAEANRIAGSLLEASASFGYSLPECLTGQDRRETARPIRYPEACSPQAWASGSVLLLLRLLIGLEPACPAHVRRDVLVDGKSWSVTLDGLPARVDADDRS
ncbi:amylo-alpha-1,6-glucosidase [Rhizomonospora bruguierae]|uniref:amylo-alpha-1,6-glucosidase n=1 Tax=Rhizomonospora bruguierae TaxID=1581705 RepID=UPI001BCF48A5|nr:glycogen debranching N-terminal domain-containing protein [Micromonospora sp. NBRC 107566]